MNGSTSDTTSFRTGRFARGSTVTVSPETSESAVTHPSPSRPFTRTPQVPHEAWKHECRSASEGSWCSWIQRSASSTVLRSVTGTSNSS